VTPDFAPESRFFVPISFGFSCENPAPAAPAPGTARTGTLSRACIEYFEIISHNPSPGRNKKKIK
jgi:hypothetical protein